MVPSLILNQLIKNDLVQFLLDTVAAAAVAAVLALIYIRIDYTGRIKCSIPFYVGQNGTRCCPGLHFSFALEVERPTMFTCLVPLNIDKFANILPEAFQSHLLS